MRNVQKKRYYAILAVAVLLAGTIWQTSSVNPPVSLAERPVLYTIKAPVAGLMSRKGRPPAQYESVLNAFVIDVNWQDVEPNGPEAQNFSSIDADLAYATSKNMAVRLRLRAGRNAPEWLKNRVGSFSNCDKTAPDQCGTVPHFWKQEFIDQYARIQSLLAARYDANPVLREVVIAGCQTIWSEPFFRKPANDTELGYWQAAGITAAADKNCHRKQIEAHKVWQRTRSTLAVNPFDEWNGAGFTDNVNFSLEMVQYCVDQLGADRCIFGHNGIRNTQEEVRTYNCADYGSVNWSKKAAMTKLLTTYKCKGYAVYFQTATTANIAAASSTLQATIEGTLDCGAASVELPQGYDSILSLSSMAGYDNRLVTNVKGAVVVYGAEVAPPPPPPPATSTPAPTTDPTVPGSSVPTSDGAGEIIAADRDGDGVISDEEIAIAGAPVDPQQKNALTSFFNRRLINTAVLMTLGSMIIALLGGLLYFLLRHHHHRIAKHLLEDGIYTLPPPSVLIRPSG